MMVPGAMVPTSRPWQMFNMKCFMPADIKFGGPSDYDPARSTFCLIPYGDGWGNRIMFAAPQACIPVITQVRNAANGMGQLWCSWA